MSVLSQVLKRACQRTSPVSLRRAGTRSTDQSFIRDAHGDVADLSVEVIGEGGLDGGERSRGVGRIAEKEVDIAVAQVGAFGVGACELHRLQIFSELHLKYLDQSMAGAVPMARRRSRRRIKKNIRLWSGELMGLSSKAPCSRQHPMSRSWRARRRLAAKVRGGPDGGGGEEAGEDRGRRGLRGR